MIVFKNNMKRIIRDRSNLFTMIIVPVFFIVMVLTINSQGSNEIKIGVVDKDETKLTEMLIKNLQQRSDLILMTEEELEKELISMKISYGFVIPSDFTKDLLDMKNPQLKSYSIKEGNIALPTTIYIENFLNGAKYLAKGVHGNDQLFYRGMEGYEKGSINLQVKHTANETRKRGITLASLGFLVMSMMFFSTFSANMVLEDRENKTFYRVLSSSLSLKRYMFENLLSFLVLSQAQVLLVFSIMKFVFKMDLGPSFLNLYMILLTFSLVSISFGVALTSLGKDTRQVSGLASFLITPMMMLGGGFWPREVMPTTLQNIGKFIPITWVLKGTEKILSGQSLGSAIIEISILLLFSLVFFLLGTWRKADVELK